MAHKLNTEYLNEYNCTRINPQFAGQTCKLISAELAPDRKSARLTDLRGERSRGNFVLTTLYHYVPEGKGYESIEMALEPHVAGVHDIDVINFLEAMVSHDQIFRRGQPLQDKAIPSTTLRREPSQRNAMICSIIDRSASQERVIKGMYDYMTRVWVYYALHGCGKFSSK